jgi:hypothetical protein
LSLVLGEVEVSLACCRVSVERVKAVQVTDAAEPARHSQDDDDEPLPLFPATPVDGDGVVGADNVGDDSGGLHSRSKSYMVATVGDFDSCDYQ